MNSARPVTGLVLVTNTFPFGTGEEFIENEFDALAAGFDAVLVVATKSGDSPHTRPLAPNAQAVRAEGGRPRGSAIPGLVARGQWGVVTSGRFSLAKPKPMVADALFEGQARKALAALVDQLDQTGISGWDEAVIYSYWLHTTARLAELLRTELRRRYPALRIVRLVSRAHRYDLYLDVAPFGHLPQRGELLAAMDEVFPVSQQGLDYLRTRWPSSAPKLTLARLGTPDPGTRIEARQVPPHVLTFSTSAPVKRLDRVPGILAELQRRGVPAAWTHWGDGEGLAEIQAAAESAIGADRVHFEGRVDHAVLLDRLAAGHWTCMLSVSASEGLPVSMMEACSVGLPIVATAVGGVPEIVRPAESGILIPADFTDAQAADAVEQLTTMSAGDYQQLCNGARTVWEQNFDLTTNNAAFLARLTRGTARAD